MRKATCSGIVGALVLSVAAGAYAQNATTPGAITSYTTLVCAGFEWRISGDDNQNCAVAVEYRKQGDTAWKNAQPLLRVEPGSYNIYNQDPGNLLAGSIFWLEPGTTYEAQLTLNDPDGGNSQQTVTVTTRAEPQASGTGRTLYVIPGSGGGTGTQGDPFRGLAAANAASQPGDVFLLQAGTYSRLVVTKNGAADNPIVYRGASVDTVFVDGGGQTSAIDLTGRQYIMIENVTCQGSRIAVWAPSGAVGITVRWCKLTVVGNGSSRIGIYAGGTVPGRDFFIADNVIQMNAYWPDGQKPGYLSGGTGMTIIGTGHVICHNHIMDAWDGVSLASDDPSVVTSNVDIYNNLVERCQDDGVEMDYVRHNVRAFKNRIMNVGCGLSSQPCFGGPTYDLFNDIFNCRIKPYKLHVTPTGIIAFHNTTICSRNGWNGGDWRNTKLRNNLILGGLPNTPTVDTTGVKADLEYDGYNRQGSTLIRFNGVSYASLAAFYSGAGQEHNGREVTLSAFASALYPHDPTWTYNVDGYGAPYALTDVDLQLSASSTAIDHGSVLDNINDGFAGAAPDLGCYERGRALPQYGPRVSNSPPTASAGSDVTDGAPPLTVNFTGSGTDTDGTIVSYSWDFGDGIGTSTEQNPSYVYDLVGAYTATLTVTDNDGATGQATVDITVSGNRRPTALASADVTSGEAPLEVSFTGEGTDEDGTVVSYHWTFGDGSSSDEQNPSHTFAKAGDYTVTLTVTDNDGGFGQDRLIIHVTAALGADAVVDNKDTSAGKAFRTISGNWTISSAGTSIWNPADPAPSFRRQSVQTGAENARAEWTCKSLPAGEYEVFAWWPNVAYIPGANVAYEVYHAAGMTSVRVNQGLNGGTWVSLGKYSFAPGAHKVQIHNGQSGPGQYIAADAVRFVRTGVAKVAAVDNKDNGGGKGFQVVSGKWSSGSGTNIWDPADPKASYVRTAAQAGAETARAAWMCSYLPAGQYEVFAWWPKSTGMGQSVAYVVWHAAGTTTVRVNQSVGGGTWVSLGTYNVAAGAHKVQIHNGQSAPGSFVAADAVKFVRK